MNYFQNLYSLLLGIIHARVKGGRVKRFVIFCLSLAVVVGSVWLMYRWSFIHTSKHVVYLSHPITVDTASNHAMKVGLEIRTTEGYTLKNRDSDPYVYEHSVRLMPSRLDHGKKVPLPFHNDIKSLNYYLQDSIIISGDSLSSKFFPISEPGNLLVLGHYYNCDYTEIQKGEPFRCLIQEDIDKEHKGRYGAVHTFVIENDPYCLKLPLGEKLHKKLSDGHVSFSGDFNVDWYYIVFPANDEVSVFTKTSKSTQLNTWTKGLFKLHDISRHYYEFCILTQCIDEVELTFKANEMMEISHPFANAKLEDNAISVKISGECYSDQAGLSGSQMIRFYTKNLESENAQLVRMFLLMTLCSFALGFFLKTLSEYLWIMVRKIQKREINENR